MGSKILRKLAMQLQSSTSYESNAMTQVAFSDGIFNQGFDPIEDDGIIGVGFNNTPLQGPRHVGGNYSINVDPLTIPPFLTAVLGDVSSTEYQFLAAHTKKLSIAELNSVNCIKYANCYAKSLKLSGSKGGLIKGDLEVFTLTAQVREAVGNFPTIATAPGVPLSFHEMGGSTGYFRVGDQANSLALADDINVDSFSIDIMSGFDEMYANESDLLSTDAFGSLIPIWGMTPPGVKFSFKVPKYLTEQYQNWQDAHTPLQAELYIFKGATKSMKIQIPNFIPKVSLESGDLTSVSIEAAVGRNGVDTDYTNAYMAFNSPIKFTVVNS